MIGSKLRRILVFVVLLAVVAEVVWTALSTNTRPGPAPGPGMLVAALDVGQADSIFVRSPAGRTMLVDAGNERADIERVILPYLKKQGVSSLDYLVLTHPDQDHVGGMPALLDAVKVGTFVDSVQPGITNQAYAQTLQRVQSKGIKAVRARRGRADVDLGAGLEVQVLGPEDPLITVGGANTNNNSVVLRLTHGAVSALLTGDIEKEAEERLLAHRDSLRSQILKVGHHGSQGSSTAEFLEVVKPEVALISAGAGNSYGHPHRAALQRLEKVQARVYRTDLNGTIEVTSDGRGYGVAPEKQGR